MTTLPKQTATFGNVTPIRPKVESIKSRPSPERNLDSALLKSNAGETLLSTQATQMLDFVNS